MRINLKSKFLLMFSVFFVIVLVAISMTISFGHRNNILNDYGRRATDIAVLAADGLDGDKLVEYARTLKKDDEYYRLRSELVTIKEHITSVEYLYVIVPTEDDLATYIFDIYTQQEYETEEVDEGDLGFIETLTDEDFGNAKKVFRTGKIINDLEITNTDYGHLASTYAPVADASGKTVALVGVDVNMDEIMQYMREFTIQMMSIVGSIVLVCCAILLVVIQRSVIRPVREIEQKVCEFAGSDHTNGCEQYAINLKTRDELNDVAQSFNRMMEEIENYIANLEYVTAEKERIGAELNVATQIQASMLPSIFPPFPNRKEFNLHASMQPAKEVGGDFYDFFMVDDDHLAVVIADVSGKGVPAALFMVIAKTLIKNYTQEGKSPAEVFSSVNNQLCENNDAGMFVTAWMGILEISSGKLTYVNAGHNPPLLKKADGSFAYIRCRPNFILAGMDGTRYGQHELTLGKDDILYLYTDGVTEATSAEEQLYGEQRLQQVLDKNADSRLDELLRSIKADIDLFVNGAEQFDDITMLVMKISEK